MKIFVTILVKFSAKTCVETFMNTSIEKYVNFMGELCKNLCQNSVEGLQEAFWDSKEAILWTVQFVTPSRVDVYVVFSASEDDYHPFGRGRKFGIMQKVLRIYEMKLFVLFCWCFSPIFPDGK